MNCVCIGLHIDACFNFFPAVFRTLGVARIQQKYGQGLKRIRAENDVITFY